METNCKVAIGYLPDPATGLLYATYGTDFHHLKHHEGCLEKIVHCEHPELTSENSNIHLDPDAHGYSDHAACHGLDCNCPHIHEVHVDTTDETSCKSTLTGKGTEANMVGPKHGSGYLNLIEVASPCHYESGGETSISGVDVYVLEYAVHVPDCSF